MWKSFKSALDPEPSLPSKSNELKSTTPRVVAFPQRDVPRNCSGSSGERKCTVQGLDHRMLTRANFANPLARHGLDAQIETSIALHLMMRNNYESSHCFIRIPYLPGTFKSSFVMRSRASLANYVLGYTSRQVYGKTRVPWSTSKIADHQHPSLLSGGLTSSHTPSALSQGDLEGFKNESS